MNSQDQIETDAVEIRSLSAAERSAWHARIVREARTARDVALGRMLIRLALATVRGARTLASALRAARRRAAVLTPTDDRNGERIRKGFDDESLDVFSGVAGARFRRRRRPPRRARPGEFDGGARHRERLGIAWRWITRPANSGTTTG